MVIIRVIVSLLYVVVFVGQAASQSKSSASWPHPRNDGLAQVTQVSEAPSSYVQISSVSTDPMVIRSPGEPASTVITVQVFSSGVKKGSNVQATVAVVTYRTEPPDNNVEYLDSPQTQTLGDNPTVFKFKAKVTDKTQRGRIIIQGDIRATSGGIPVHDAEPPSFGRAELTIE